MIELETGRRARAQRLRKFQRCGGGVVERRVLHRAIGDRDVPERVRAEELPQRIDQRLIQGVDLVRAVDSEGDPMAEPTHGAMLHLEASCEPVQALGEVVLLVVGVGEATVEPQPERAEVARIHVERREHTAAAPRFTAQVRRPAHVPDVRRDGHLAGGCHREAGVPAGVPEIVAGLGTALQLRPRRHVVLDRVGTAAHARLIVGDVPGAEDVADLGLQVLEVDADQVAGVVHLIVRREAAVGVAEVVDPLPHREVPAGGTGLAPLGDDLNDAVRRLRAV